MCNPHLGDSRGFLLAQLHDARNGRLLDLGTKDSGRSTPWSRGGDVSLVETDEALARHDEPSPTRSASWSG